MISFAERYAIADSVYKNLDLSCKVNVSDCIEAAAVIAQQADDFIKNEHYDSALNELFKSRDLTRKGVIGRPDESKELRLSTLRKIVVCFDKLIESDTARRDHIRLAEIYLVKSFIIGKKSIGDSSLSAVDSFNAAKLFSRIIFSTQNDSDSYLKCYKIVELCYAFMAVINKRCKAATASDSVSHLATSMASLQLRNDTASVYQNSQEQLTHCMKQAITQFKRRFKKTMSTLAATGKFLEIMSACETLFKQIKITIFPQLKDELDDIQNQCRKYANQLPDVHA